MAGHIAKEDLARAREMDLLTYKQTFEPWDLVKIKENYYQLKSHDSLKINYHNGRWLWNWWSRGIGGRSALDYLISVEGMDFLSAASQILGERADQGAATPAFVPPEEKERGLVIPPRAKDNTLLYEYLCKKRGIDREIVQDFADSKEIYLTADGYANCAFVGHDENGQVKLVALRGIRGDYKNTTAGSDRRYPFMTRAEPKNSVVHLFEAPIDLLSYAALMKQLGVDYRKHNLLSLCGIYMPKKNPEESKIPTALLQYIEDHPYTDTVCLHLDNDGPGRLAAHAMKLVIEKKGIRVLDQPPPQGYKDCNEFLKKGADVRSMKREKEAQRE